MLIVEETIMSERLEKNFVGKCTSMSLCPTFVTVS